jgi:hypothetical protein
VLFLISSQIAYQKQQTQIQDNLKDSVEKQSMKSLERLSNLLQPNSEDNEPELLETSLAVDAMETTTIDMRGENKAPAKKSKRRKHSLKSSKRSTEKQQKYEKQRPKHFVQF